MTLEELTKRLKQDISKSTGDCCVVFTNDVRQVLNYIENESIPKEKYEELDRKFKYAIPDEIVEEMYIPKERIREMIAEEITSRNELPKSAIETRTMHEYTRATLQELLGDDE